MTIAAVLLAAGRSTRFGADDKIAAPLGGVPLGLHAARTLAGLPFAARFVVTGTAPLDWPGFTTVTNPHPDAGLARSIAIGIAAARGAGIAAGIGAGPGPGAVLIALADMPFVSAAHLMRLIDCYHGPASLAASFDGERRMPPALFGADWFAELEALSGDKGARALLDRAQAVEAAPGELLDIDRPEDLSDARLRLRTGRADADMQR